MWLPSAGSVGRLWDALLDLYPECGASAFFTVDVVDSACVPVDLSTFPTEVQLFLSGMLAAAASLELYQLVRWARLVRRRFSSRNAQWKLFLSPLVWYTDLTLVFCQADVPWGCKGVSGAFGKSPWSPSCPNLATTAILVSSSPCKDCARPRWCDVRFVCHVSGFSRRAVCVYAVPGVPYQRRAYAWRNTMRLEGVCLGKFVPLFLMARQSCAGQFLCPPASSCVAWPSVFTGAVASTARGGNTSGFRVITAKCGGASDKLHAVVGVILRHDPDAASLHEPWDADVSLQTPLRSYVCSASTITGGGKGMAVLIHRKMWLAGARPSVSVLLDTRSCFVVLAKHGGLVLLYGDIHLDPELNSTGKEEVLTGIGTVICKVRPHFVVSAGDFNVPRSEYSLVTRMLRPGHILNGLRVPYKAGEHTNSLSNT